MPHRQLYRAAALGTIVLLGAGCESLGGLGSPHQTTGRPNDGIDRDTQVAVLMADNIQSLQRLSTGSPAEQAEIVTAARQGYERSAGGSAQLRYALVLATPGHAGRDAEHARLLLRELAARPESLAPVERALSLFELSQLDRELGLVSDNERLQATATHSVDQDRLASANRRLQAELDDNARLRHQLDEAQAKLDTIANIEPNLSKSTPEVRKK
ncbi:MAG TPA: hypothetical protein VGN77_07285 [Steroidobacteraceae bacterium]|nr:hypothetical protein [Steroidobacteraceae bacterium]